MTTGLDPARWIDKPTLTGQLVQLRPFREEDFDAIGEALADPEVLRLTGSVHSDSEAAGRPLGLDEVGLSWYRSRKDAPDRIDLAIVALLTSRCVGEAVLNDLDVENRSCNFRILIGPGARDRGLGTEATRLLVTHGFEVLGLHRIALEVYAFNPRAQRAYEKASFKVEGRRRESFRYGGDWVDSISMAMLEQDPR